MKSFRVFLMLLGGLTVVHSAYAQDTKLEQMNTPLQKAIRKCQAVEETFPSMLDDSCIQLLKVNRTEEQKQDAFAKKQVLYPFLFETPLILMGRGFLNRKTSEYLGLTCETRDCNVYRFVYFPSKTKAFFYGLAFTFKPELETDSVVYYPYSGLKAYLKDNFNMGSPYVLDWFLNTVNGLSGSLSEGQLTYQNGWNWSSEPKEVGNGNFIDVMMNANIRAFRNARDWDQLTCFRNR